MNPNHLIKISSPFLQRRAECLGQVASYFNLPACARSLGLIGLIGLASLFPIQANPQPSSFGVWDRGEAMDFKEYPFLRGTSCDAPWDAVEKKPGVYDWSVMDEALEHASKNKISVYLSFEAGPKTPDWVYEKGVPKVLTNNERHEDKFPHYPYYSDPKYKMYFHRFLTEVAKRIRSYPKDKKERIAFIQVKTGCTGDECAYKGEPLDRKYSLERESAAWQKFRLETFAMYAKLFNSDSDLKISLLFNDLAPESQEEGKHDFSEMWHWATKTLKDGFGIKNGALSRGHHLCGEAPAMTTYLPYLVAPKELTLFRRSEMDQTWTRPLYQLNVPLNFYWGAINALNSGQSVWDVTKGAIVASKEQGFDYSFYFFNKYAGQIYPKTATDAFCALHKGLDAADTKAYPEAKFGKAERKNVDRMLKICAEFAKYGAAVDDENALKMGQVAQRGDQTGFNDVGWLIWPDNYSRLLEQIDADATSIPLWRVGGPITPTSSIYSRFARSFEHVSGKDAMYFRLHEGFSQDAKPKVMTITVVWYDGQAGSTWKLNYDAGSSAMKTAVTVTGKGDNKWHHEVIALRDAVFRRGGTKGSDFALVNADTKNDIFSLVEVHRGEPEVPPLRPPTNWRVVPNEKGTKYDKNEGSDKNEESDSDKGRDSNKESSSNARSNNKPNKADKADNKNKADKADKKNKADKPDKIKKNKGSK